MQRIPPFTRTQEAVDTPFDNSTNGFDADNVQEAIEECITSAPGKSPILTWQVHKCRSGNNSMSNATWFDSWPNTDPTGSYSGYATSCKPLIIHGDNLLLKRVIIIFRRANFDWRSSPGNIFMQLGFWNLSHNGSSVICKLLAELPGSFSGNNTGDGTFKFEVLSFSVSEGNHSFTKNDIIGVQLRKDISQAGQIQSLVDPLVFLEFG